jgi:hypothetical protein
VQAPRVSNAPQILSLLRGQHRAVGTPMIVPVTQSAVPSWVGRMLALSTEFAVISYVVLAAESGTAVLLLNSEFH